MEVRHTCAVDASSVLRLYFASVTRIGNCQISQFPGEPPTSRPLVVPTVPT
jgi:hypothetical protein